MQEDEIKKEHILEEVQHVLENYTSIDNVKAYLYNYLSNMAV